MSDSGTGGHGRTPGTTSTGGVSSTPTTRRPHPVAMFVVGAATGEVTAASPAGHRYLAGADGTGLAGWLATLAEGPGPLDDVTTVRTWRGPRPGPDGDAGGERGCETDGRPTPWAHCTSIQHRLGLSLLVVLRDDAPPAGGATDRAIPDRTCGVFTLDAVGRVDSWGPNAQRWTGFPPECVLGSDTTLLHPVPARLAGEPHRALTRAYRTGEHRGEGWLVRSDGRSVWTETTTCALYDARERLIGFATVIRDLTALRRLRAATTDHVPLPRRQPAVRRARPAPARPPSVTRPGRVPGQRRPPNG